MCLSMYFRFKCYISEGRKECMMGQSLVLLRRFCFTLDVVTWSPSGALRPAGHRHRGPDIERRMAWRLASLR